MLNDSRAGWLEVTLNRNLVNIKQAKRPYFLDQTKTFSYYMALRVKKGWKSSTSKKICLGCSSAKEERNPGFPSWLVQHEFKTHVSQCWASVIRLANICLEANAAICLYWEVGISELPLKNDKNDSESQEILKLKKPQDVGTLRESWSFILFIISSVYLLLVLSVVLTALSKTYL